MELCRIRKLVEETITRASATYGSCGTVDVISEDGYAYTDYEMVESIVSNIASNAALASSLADDNVWSVEAYIDASGLDISIWNACRCEEDAKDAIERGVSDSAFKTGTGVGVVIIKRVVEKLLGRITYDFCAGRVHTHVFIPLGVEMMSYYSAEYQGVSA